MRLSPPQRGVVTGMACGLALTIAAFGIAALLHPGAPASMRLHLFVLSALAPATALAVCIARLARHRFMTPDDIDGSGLVKGTAQAGMLQALLQNTLEQLALALPVYAAWAVLAPAALVGCLPVAGLLFLLGRALFFAGYARGAPARALGFALTFYPTVLLLAGALVAGIRFLGS
jgi:hypothetical protein